MGDVITELKRLYEAGTKGPLTLIRYEHGGGRLYKEEPRTLVADFFHEEDRDLFFAMHRHLPALLKIAEAARSVDSAVKARLLLGSLPEGVVWTERHHDAAMAEGRAIGALIDALSALKPNQEGDAR